jgi:hypothetical protein
MFNSLHTMATLPLNSKGVCANSRQASPATAWRLVMLRAGKLNKKI